MNVVINNFNALLTQPSFHKQKNWENHQTSEIYYLQLLSYYTDIDEFFRHKGHHTGVDSNTSSTLVRKFSGLSRPWPDNAFLPESKAKATARQAAL